MVLDKAGLLAFKPKVETIEVEELGDKVCIKQLSGPESVEYSDQLNKAFDADDKMLNHIALTHCLCDEQGVLLFTPGSESDVKGLYELPPMAVLKISTACIKLNPPIMGKREEAKKSPEPETGVSSEG